MCAFDSSRLPSTASDELRFFFEDGGDSFSWFEMCQGLPGCEYLSRAPDGSPYELVPTLANLSRAASQLLGEPESSSLAKLQACP